MVMDMTCGRQLEETSRVETRVVELASEVETRGREVQRSLHTQAVTHAHLQQANTLADALKTDNFVLTRHLRNIKVGLLLLQKIKMFIY